MQIRDIGFCNPCFYTIKNKAVAQCVTALLVFSRIDIGTVTDCKSATSGLFDHHNKQIILRANASEYLLFHEMAHLKHFEEIGNAYLPLKAWQRETYVFEEIWKQKHLWTKQEQEHALKYVNDVRDRAGQSLIIKKL